ncbi:MAG: thioredoxin family protein, partial [Steroidobacteraceae bacterium]
MNSSIGSSAVARRLVAGACAVGVAMIFSGCAREAPAPADLPSSAPAQAPPVVQADVPGIDWFAGSVDQAFAAAQQSGRPVFLYWGAVWCPPCQQIQSTVFSRRDFIEKSRLFVPVHLDGDTAGAQKLGEVFKVTGYPTVLILRPDHSEVLRIAGSMDLRQYAGVLDLALGDLAPIGATLAAVSGGRSVSDANCKRLAYHGWLLEDR